jgi:predicted transcriptional regulator
VTFVQKYFPDNFLRVLNTEDPKSIASIIIDVGCGKNTAKRYLQELEKAGKIKRVGVEGSIHYGYVIVPEVQEPSRRTKQELEGAIHFWCCIDEFREEHPDNQHAQLVCTLIRSADPEIYDNYVIDAERVDADLARLREWLLK